MNKKKVAFICVHNSCRSQIAEALGKHLASDVFESYSAGTETKPQINQDAVRIMKELYGIDMEKTQYSKLIDDIPRPDIAISMGCNVGCPFIGRAFDDNWELDDPTGKSDDDFKDIIKRIEEKILKLKMSLRGFPMDSYVALVNQGEKCLSQFNYVVPAYQRPYSWKEEQIDDFLKTIIEGFNDDVNKFFGTMQFVVKDSGYEIVDGQQRLTTIKLFLYILSGLSGNSCFDLKIRYNNMENANDFLESLMARNIDEVQSMKKDKRGNADIKDINNIFDANIQMLKEKILSWRKDDPKKREIKQYATDLLEYFSSKIYVVVLETDKSISLPEVVSIFNTINTTGMDLNSADIFKFQYYDYLCKTYKPQEKENDDYWMEKINSCYKRIEDYNLDKPIKKHIFMSNVLTIYQHCLCAKYEKNFKILAKAPERFFDDVFKNPANYKESLRFEEFNRLVEEFIDFYSDLEANRITMDNPMHALSIQLIKETRYPRYWTIPYVYVFFNGSDLDNKQKAMEVGYKVFSYLAVHSMNYAKAINPVHTEICNEILPSIAEKKDITNAVIQRQWKDPYDKTGENKRAQVYFKERLTKNAIANGKVGLFCLLLGLYYEKNNTLISLKEKFFSWDTHPYDIEHIYSYDSFSNDMSYDGDAKASFNGLGNLIILEQKINRDMGRKGILLPNDKFSHSAEYYEKSDYKIVKEFTPLLQDWDINKVEKRAEEQLDILINEILKIE